MIRKPDRAWKPGPTVKNMSEDGTTTCAMGREPMITLMAIGTMANGRPIKSMEAEPIPGPTAKNTLATGLTINAKVGAHKITLTEADMKANGKVINEMDRA